MNKCISYIFFSFLVCPSLESNQKKSDRAITKAKGTNHKACSTRQDDPYKVYEHLQLSLEEVCRAYYLSFYRFNWKMVDNMSSFIVFIKFSLLSCKVHVIHQVLEISFLLAGVFPFIWTWLSVCVGQG